MIYELKLHKREVDTIKKAVRNENEQLQRLIKFTNISKAKRFKLENDYESNKSLLSRIGQLTSQPLNTTK